MTSRSAACRPAAGIAWTDELADSHDIFVRNLRILMGKQGMTAAELARRLGLKTRGAVSHWLNGLSGPDLRTLGRIAEIFDVPVAELFVEEDATTPPPRPPVDRVEDAVKALVETLGYEGTVRISRRKR